MSAYLVVDLDSHDHDAITGYRSKALPLIAEAGGRLVALDDAPLQLEGWAAGNMLIIQFPTMQAIQDLFASPDCAPLARQRQSAAGSQIVALRGFEPA
ncbi:MAG: DUF1330 domain-containing protein [Shinella sp.]|uniref:DUF1330 domain-containing protein n=1 Tax=Shinella sp. TaxID=1870904 RepID=UPI00403725F4